LTLLEKLIDAKDFYIETEISYSKNKATISVNDNNIFEKLKKARGEDFIFYYPENVNKNKKLHEWDEDRRNSKDNFFGKLDRQFDANKKEFTFTLSDEFKKEFTNKAINYLSHKLCQRCKAGRVPLYGDNQRHR
jgi:hypothetical protein